LACPGVTENSVPSWVEVTNLQWAGQISQAGAFETGQQQARSFAPRLNMSGAGVGEPFDVRDSHLPFRATDLKVSG